MPIDDKTPVTVLTGFLGSGKTTLLNALIRARQDLRIAVIVNEFGELGIDAGLIESTMDDVIQLSNGCLCCSVRGDLLSACARLALRRSAFDWLVVETSGLADPAPIIQSFLLEDGPSEWFRLDGLVTLVDAHNIARQKQPSITAQRQIALADRIILTKTDTVDRPACEALTARLRLFNPEAEIVQSSAERPGTSAITGLGAYELGSLPARIFLAPAPRHDGDITSVSFRFTRPFDLTAFSRFIKQLVVTAGEDLLRVKGILDIDGEDRRFVFHGVQALIEGDVIGPWEQGARSSTLVFIGRNLDRALLESALRDCLHKS
jgi:G3E family GTPase